LSGALVRRAFGRTNSTVIARGGPLLSFSGSFLAPGVRAAGHGYCHCVDELVAGPLFWFADWPNELVPRRAAGVYTIWRDGQFIYVGMSGRGAQQEDFTAARGQPRGAKGLWTRLNSHASGRRSGDQFNLYICDRFIVPLLTSSQQHQIGQGQLRLDRMTKDFIREHLSYRFTIIGDGAQALATERAIRAGSLPSGPPHLNPL
jgi:hypothetical protein